MKWGIILMTLLFSASKPQALVLLVSVMVLSTSVIVTWWILNVESGFVGSFFRMFFAPNLPVLKLSIIDFTLVINNDLKRTANFLRLISILLHSRMAVGIWSSLPQSLAFTLDHIDLIFSIFNLSRAHEPPWMVAIFSRMLHSSSTRLVAIPFWSVKANVLLSGWLTLILDIRESILTWFHLHMVMNHWWVIVPWMLVYWVFACRKLWEVEVIMSSFN